MRFHSLAVLLSCSAVLLLSCGGDSDEGGAQLKFYKDFNAVACKKSFECCTVAEANELIIIDDEVQNAEECTTKLNEFASAIASLGGGTLQSEKEGRITVQYDKAPPCLDAVSAMTCDAFSKLTEAQRNDPFKLDACRPMVVSNVAPGGACHEDIECTTGLCKDLISSGDDSQATGTCGAVPKAGEACSNVNAVCESGYYCGTDPADITKKICLTKKADGQACFFDGECASEHCLAEGEGGAVDTCSAAPTICDGV